MAVSSTSEVVLVVIPWEETGSRPTIALNPNNKVVGKILKSELLTLYIMRRRSPAK